MADIDVSDDDVLLEDTRTVLRVSDRASTYDAITMEGYISTILAVDEPDAMRHGGVCRPLRGHGSDFVMTYFKLMSTDFNPRELGYIKYLTSKLQGNTKPECAKDQL